MAIKDIVIDYKHRQAGHCESGATSNLFNFYGIDFQNPWHLAPVVESISATSPFSNSCLPR